MTKLSFFYLFCLQGLLVNLGHANPIGYSYLRQPTCTTTIVSSQFPQTPPTATSYISIVTATSSVKCSGCALRTALVVFDPVPQSQIFDTTITLSASTVLSYVCEADPAGPTVFTTANPTANDFSTIGSPVLTTSIIPSTTANPTSNDFISPTSSPQVTLPTAATCYTPTGTISTTPAKTVDGNGIPVPSGVAGIIVRDSCPETKEEVAQCPLLCFAKSFGPDTPLFQCSEFFDDVLFHSCSPCLPPCDRPVSGTADNCHTSIPPYTYA